MKGQEFTEWCQQSYYEEDCRRPLVMGILNITPDSFSDGGQFLQPLDAFAQAMRMVEEGADLIDIGGESSRPGAKPVSCSEELERVIPIIERIRANSDICISIDTYKPPVMQAAVQAGASMINDIYALNSGESLEMVAKLQVPICLMHMQGTPSSMQHNPTYNNGVVVELKNFFQARIAACLQAGINLQNIILDPGFGFGKTVSQNLSMVKHLAELNCFNRPMLLGVSRKSTIGIVLDNPVAERLIGGIAISVFAALQGIKIFRTHDVDATKQALQMLQAIVSINQE